jgi:hypothetical protein
MKNIIAALSIGWQNNLTQQERDSWDVYAANVGWQNKLGQSVNLTGFTHFIRSNSPRIQAGATRQDAGPIIFNLATPDDEFDFQTALAGQNLMIEFNDTTAPWNTENNAHLFVYVGRPTGPGVAFFNGPWRFARNVAGVDPGGIASPLIVAMPYPTAAGMKLWMRSRVSRADGRLSEFAYANHIIT